MDNNVKKSIHTYQKNHYSYHAKTFCRPYPFIKSGPFERVLNWCKTDGMVNDNSSGYNSKIF